MSKKNKQTQTSSKAFSTDAFSTLKELQNKLKLESAQKAENERQAAIQKAKRDAEILRETRDLRFTDNDLLDDNMSDEEIFAASMREMESQSLDLYQSKFNTKEQPKKQKKEESPILSMTDDEREFAIFTQEMAISKVERLVAKQKPVHKVRNKKKYDANGKIIQNDELENTEETSLDAYSPVDISAPKPQPGMKTQYITPTTSVTQIEKGADITQQPDVADSVTTSQKKLLKTIKHYESRYGMLMTLHLRGLALNAAISRLNDFIDACIREKRPYALIVCGKGLNSADKPVIKEYTIDILRNDNRVTEYVPVINEDGDFGSVYAAFKLNT